MFYSIHTVKSVGGQIRSTAKSLYCKALSTYQAITTKPAYKVLCTVGRALWKILHWAIIMVELHDVWFYGGLIVGALLQFTK